MKKHYISMGGIRGCLPSHCDVHFSKKEAREHIQFIYELPPYGRAMSDLKKDSFIDFANLVEQNWQGTAHMEKYGNDYAEIIECGSPECDCGFTEEEIYD